MIGNGVELSYCIMYRGCGLALGDGFKKGNVSSRHCSLPTCRKKNEMRNESQYGMLTKSLLLLLLVARCISRPFLIEWPVLDVSNLLLSSPYHLSR